MHNQDYGNLKQAMKVFDRVNDLLVSCGLVRLRGRYDGQGYVDIFGETLAFHLETGLFIPRREGEPHIVTVNFFFDPEQVGISVAFGREQEAWMLELLDAGDAPCPLADELRAEIGLVGKGPIKIPDFTAGLEAVRKLGAFFRKHTVNDDSFQRR